MNKQAFWRKTHDKFEALNASGPARDALGATYDNETWNLRGGSADPEERAILQARFQSLATRAGAAATGATHESAFDAWLDLVRDKMPHHFRKSYMESGAPKIQQILLSEIAEPPEVSRVKDGFRPSQEKKLMWVTSKHPLLVDRDGDRYQFVRANWDATQVVARWKAAEAVARRNHGLVPCFVRTFWGTIRRLCSASADLCFALENEALETEDATGQACATGHRQVEAPIRSRAVFGSPRLAEWLKAKMAERDLMSSTRVKKLGGPDPKTTTLILNGGKVSRRVLGKLARALTQEGTNVSPTLPPVSVDEMPLE
jgi:hypothetical protein